MAAALAPEVAAAHSDILAPHTGLGQAAGHMNLPWCEGQLGTMLKIPQGGMRVRVESPHGQPSPPHSVCSAAHVSSAEDRKSILLSLVRASLLICYFYRQSDATKETIS